MELDDKICAPINETNSKQSLRLKVLKVERTSSRKLIISAIDPNTQQNGDQPEDNDENVKKLILEGVWTQSNIIKNAILHLINPSFDRQTNTFTIDNSKGLLVIEPDSLLTCTFVASSLFCERKTWLNHVFLGQVGTNRAMLVGTLVHEVFQYGVKNKIVDIDKLTKYLDELLDDATVMLEIYSVELHLRDIRSEAISYISSVKEWIEKFMLAGPRYPLTNEANLEVKISQIRDIEENVWSTKYGLKGKIDVTGLVKVHDRRTKSLAEKIIPLELKTGNPNLSSSHAAQVSLYSMMIEDRYAETNQGFVIYLKDKAAMHNVSLTHSIKRDLVQRRNQVNYHMKNFYFGPEMLDQPRVCSNCDRQTECILMSNIYTPNRIDRYSTMKSLESQAVGHLDGRFIKFFQSYHEKLTRIISRSFDDGASGPIPSSFWNYSSEEAETKGTGYGKLQASCDKLKSDSGSFVTFKRHPKYLERLKSEGFKDLSQSNGNKSSQNVKRVKIEDYFKSKSTSPQKTNLKPFNTKLDFARCRIAISLDCDDSDLDSQNSSTAIAIGFMNELTEDHIVIKLYEGALNSLQKDLMYRIDKIEKRSNVDIERLVLVRLLAREDWRCDRIRDLILNMNSKPKENIDLNLFILSTCCEEISEIDASKQKFVVEAASTDNYYILDEKVECNKIKVHKTIAVLTKVIQIIERSVLIVAKNIDDLVDLMKLLQSRKMRFILIDDGKSTKARFQYASNLVKVPQGDNFDLVKKFDLYIRQHEMATIVVTTFAMSVGGLLFTRRTFDYCIIYDCDNVELLLGLSPMFCSDRYILIDIQAEPTENDNSNTGKTNVIVTDDVTLGDHLRSLKKPEKIDLIEIKD